MPAQLANAPELPDLIAHVWGYFVELHQERGSNGMEASRITSSQMKDWCWASGNDLALWERKAIRAIDTVWMNAQGDSK